MTKDYKVPSERKSPKKRASKKKTASSSIGWGSLMVGMLIGLVIGLSVYLFTQFNNSTPNATTESPAPKPPVTTTKPSSSEASPEKSRFDFYTLLPEMEIFIPEQDKAAALRMPKLKRPGTYVLQVGSFRKFSDADAFKAQLALQGFEPKIQTITVDGNKWHRVRIGPITEMPALNETRARLRQNDIEFMLLKIKSDKAE